MPTTTATMAQRVPQKVSNITGIVVAAGRMHKTVKVRVTSTVFNKRVQKLFATHTDHLVHDPSSSARLGDVVAIQSGYRASTTVRHLLRAIVSPMGGSVEERPSIPTVEELVRSRREERSKRDDRLLGVADAVHRARALEDGQTEGMDEGEVQEELRQLRERQDVQAGVRKGLNGALKRLKEASKARWREMRPTITVDTADALKSQLLAEAQTWDNRSEEWYTEAHSSAGRGRGQRPREEMDWRAQFSASIAYDLRHRAAEVDGYLAQVSAFAAATTAEAETAMRAAQDELLGALCKQLAAKRGVYKTELSNLKAEQNWLYSLEWLQDHENPWRWQSHQIRLREDGRMKADAIERFFREEKGRNSPLWYAALREGLKSINLELVDGEAMSKLSKGLEAREKLIGDLEATEGEKRIATKERVKLMWEGKHLKGTTSVPNATRKAQLASDGEGRGDVNNKRALRNAKKATDFAEKALANEAEAEKADQDEPVPSIKGT